MMKGENLLKKVVFPIPQKNKKRILPARMVIPPGTALLLVIPARYNQIVYSLAAD
jgi:hypothetical protein